MKSFKEFKESTVNQDTAKERIKREKDQDKVKHDRLMDRARLRDTKTVNRQTESTVSESEFHVRLDHLDGDPRQKKANDVMKKHVKAGHIKYVGTTDKGVLFKAKSKAHADRLHKDLKPHATGVSE